MKVHTILATVGLALAVPAAAGPKAVSSVDRTADFGRYHSFGFARLLGTDENGYQSIVSENLKTSTRRQLEARGLTFDAVAPDLIVNFNARLDDRMRVTTTPSPMPSTMGMRRSYYGYRGGMYSTWPAYQDQTSMTPYKEGTLNIDIVDVAKKQLVWEAVVTDTMTSKKRDKMDDTLDNAVLAAFKKFPVPKSK